MKGGSPVLFTPAPPIMADLLGDQSESSSAMKRDDDDDDNDGDGDDDTVVIRRRCCCSGPTTPRWMALEEETAVFVCGVNAYAAPMERTAAAAAACVVRVMFILGCVGE